MLPYHHHLSYRVVANLNHVCAAGGNVEAYRRAVVLLGGEVASCEVVERHRVAVGSLDHYLAVAGVHLGVDGIHAVNANIHRVVDVTVS